ncbi:MAG: hypothetical protein ACFCVE_13915 [Phycisphaerae bacterium]
MHTVRQLERFWRHQQYARLLAEVVAGRTDLGADFAGRLVATLPGKSAAAAVAAIRLTELCQQHTPLFKALTRHLLDAQQPDGSWGDVALTALCVHALAAGEAGDTPFPPAASAGIAFLARLQRDDGLWPAECNRRMPGDVVTTALVLAQLCRMPLDPHVVRLADAVAVLEAKQITFDPATRKLWQRIGPRCRMKNAQAALLWS